MDLLNFDTHLFLGIVAHVFRTNINTRPMGYEISQGAALQSRWKPQRDKPCLLFNVTWTLSQYTECVSLSSVGRFIKTETQMRIKRLFRGIIRVPFSRDAT